MKTAPFAIRQGDVLLTPSTIPAGATRLKELRPLALGEATGHHHSLVADPGLDLADQVEMYELNGETFVRIKSEATSLVHQEHKAHPSLAPGDYKVVIQRENTDFGAAPVRD